jgi:amidohydrolase
LLFQPAEEIGAGALQILDTGILDNVCEIYGIHTAPEVPVGAVAVSPGANTGAVGGFRAVFTGIGGHAGEPHKCVDPIIAAAQFITAAQTVVSRTNDPFDPAIVTIAKIEAGTTWNVIPETASLEGTIRTLGTELFAKLGDRLGEIANGVAIASGITVEYFWQMGAPATDNNVALTEFVAETARDLGLLVLPCEAGLGGEDFALYQQKIPGVFWYIGTGGDGYKSAHHPGFRVDPAPLNTAAEMLTALAERALARLAH